MDSHVPSLAELLRLLIIKVVDNQVRHLFQMRPVLECGPQAPGEVTHHVPPHPGDPSQREHLACKERRTCFLTITRQGFINNVQGHCPQTSPKCWKRNLETLLQACELILQASGSGTSKRWEGKLAPTELLC